MTGFMKPEKGNFIVTDVVPGGIEVWVSYSARLFIPNATVMRMGGLGHLRERIMAALKDVDDSIGLWEKEVS